MAVLYYTSQYFNWWDFGGSFSWPGHDSYIYTFYLPAVFGSRRCNKGKELALAHHMGKVGQVGVTDFQKVLRMTWDFSFQAKFLG